MIKEISHIYIYPVKGLQGISLSETQIESTGLLYDRRWMLVDENGLFLSQRTLPIMALFALNQNVNGFEIWAPGKKECITLPFVSESLTTMKVTVWDDTCDAIVHNRFCNEWFSALLKIKCKLVYMPVASKRMVDPTYNTGSDMVSFADAFPMLLIGQSSLTDLNTRLAEPVLMDRFRPNLVFTGGDAFEEDSYDEFYIGSQQFKAAKPCARCTVITVNQQTGAMGKEPLTTLATYRAKNNKIYFGQNLLQTGNGIVKIGDQIHVKNRKPSII
ncbi:MAG: MOSC domain-containing protein [Bacteroidia bacterium]|nr:MOSC domain-containing protein [Bacteroidia bacterium]